MNNIPISAEIAYNERKIQDKEQIRCLNPSKINGEKLAFEWNYEPLVKVAEEFKEYEPDEENSNILGVLNPNDVVTDQPDWDLENCDPDGNLINPEDREKDGKPDRDKREDTWDGDQSKPVGQQGTSGTWQQRDPMAWYCPASFHPVEKYGIHFDAAKVRRWAQNLEKAGSNSISSDDWLITAIVACYWHEVCHGWIEDLCFLMQTINNENPYKDTHLKYKSYIYKEEAICNTVSLWMVKAFFDKHAHNTHLFDTLNKSMRSESKGYRDFYDINQWYHYSSSESDFVAGNIKRLLKTVYSGTDGLVDHVVNAFLIAPSKWMSGTSRKHKQYRRISTPLTEIYKRNKDCPLFVV